MGQKMRWAGYAGFFGAAFALAGVYEFYRSSDITTGIFEQSTFLFGGSLIVALVYWYGFMFLGKKYDNSAIFSVSILFIFLYIFSASFTFLSFLFPASNSWGVWETFFFITSLLIAAGLLLIGLAVWKMQNVFGNIAFWYGVLTMLSGALALGGHFGSFYIALLDVSLVVPEYILGALILLRAAKTQDML